MQAYPFLVLVPIDSADETSIGEWLESREIDYEFGSALGRDACAHRFHFACKEAADAFARNFVG